MFDWKSILDPSPPPSTHSPIITRSLSLSAQTPSSAPASLLRLPACCRVTALKMEKSNKHKNNKTIYLNLKMTPAPTAMAAAVARSAVF